MLEFGPIKLRAWEREDLKKVHEWENDFETMLYSRGMPQQVKSYDAVVKYYEKEMEREDRLHYIVELRDSREAIGTAVIRLENWSGVRRGNIGTYIDKNYWNKGLGKIITLALLEISFYHLNLEKCEACSIEYNKRAHRVLENCGFKRYGIERKSAFVLGRKWDWHCFDILREEYMQMRKELFSKILKEDKDEYMEKLNLS